jgi:chlorobactene glucosyltransferase
VIPLLLSTLLFIIGLVIIFWVHSRHQLDIVVQPTAPPGEAPLISVCVPARNEERNIARCVESLLKQDYPNFELIVLDDRSSDTTPEILAEIKRTAQERAVPMRIIHGEELPDGWAGKPHALHQAAQQAQGVWLCFMDADTWLTPQALSSVYAKAMEAQADLFTILTFQVLDSFWEKTVMPLVMSALSVGFSPRRVNNPNTRDAISNGQFIFIKRAVYHAIGGHSAVKDRIVEDKAISQIVKWSGYRLIIADGSQVARTRMYTSLPEMWEGWTKNVYLGLSDQLSLLLLGVFGALVLVIAALFMPAWPLLGLSWLQNGGGWQAALIIMEALTLWAVLLGVRAWVALRMGISPLWSLTTPLGAGVFAAIMLTSAWKVLSGQGVRWKGRRYSV